MSLTAERVPDEGPEDDRTVAEPRTGGLVVEAKWHPGMSLDTFDRLVLLLCGPPPSTAGGGSHDGTRAGDDDGAGRAGPTGSRGG